MNNLLKIITIAFFCLVPFTVHSQQIPKIDWYADLDYISTELPAKHYNLFARKSKDYFFSEINRLKEESGNTDIEMVLRIQQLIASMGDSHTEIDYRPLFDKNQILPLRFYWFSNGLYVTQTSKKYSEIVGCKIISINKIPVETVIDSLSSLVTIDNKAILRKNVPPLIPFLQILKYFNFASANSVEVTYKLQSGESKVIIMQPEIINKNNAVTFKPKVSHEAIALYYKNQNQYFTENYIAGDQLYYLQYNRCSGREVETKRGNIEKAAGLPSFKEYEDKVFEKLNPNPVKKIVFDVRNNPGGDSRQGREFINKLAMFLKGKPDIKVYVVLGRRTFSSAVLNALEFKKIPNVVFVGEETSGKPNHFGEVRTLKLPSSKLTVYYSTKYFKNSKKDINSLYPDVLIESSFSDYSKGIDPVFDWIVNN